MLLTQEQLMEATGYKRVSDLERCLLRQRIRFFYGRDGRIWTTTEIVRDAANGAKIQEGEIEFEA